MRFDFSRYLATYWIHVDHHRCGHCRDVHPIRARRGAIDRGGIPALTGLAPAEVALAARRLNKLRARLRAELVGAGDLATFYAVYTCGERRTAYGHACSATRLTPEACRERPHYEWLRAHARGEVPCSHAGGRSVCE